MIETNKVQEAMAEVDRQFENVREAARPAINARVNGQDPATLLAWLKRFDERQEKIEQKLIRILNFLGER